MILNVVVAGLDEAVHGAVRKRGGELERRIVGLRIHSAPILRAKRLAAYSEKYISKLQDALWQSVQKKDEEHAAVVFFVDWDESSTILRDGFWKYAILRSISKSLKKCEREQHIAEEANRIIATIRSNLDRIHANLGAIKFELVNKRNSTPFLLPIRNFHSPVLDDILRQVSADIADHSSCDDSAAKFLKTLKDRFKAAHPQARIGARSEHINSQGLVFRAPQKALHADLPAGAEHSNHCRLGSRLRLGHSYMAGFHYDADYNATTRTVRGSWQSCHSAHDVGTNASYVNIAPSDFIRDGR